MKIHDSEEPGTIVLILKYFLSFPGNSGFAIALALSLQVITATLIGAILPLLASKLKFDPAVVASPALTTIVDITGLIIYFTTAKLLLGI